MIALHTVLFAIPPTGSFVTWFWYVRIRRRFAAVVPSRVYRSGTLKPRWLTIAVRLHGIRTVIDLRRPGPGVDREREFLRGLGVRHVNVCATQRPKAPALEAFFAAIDGAEKPVLLHCLHGAGRAKLFSALYRIEYEGWSAERAARSLPLNHRGKRRFLRSYVPRRRWSPEGAPAVPSSASSSPSSRYFPAR